MGGLRRLAHRRLVFVTMAMREWPSRGQHRHFSRARLGRL